MNIEIPTFAARTHFAELIAKVVTTGAHFTITKNRIPVAQLVPIPKEKEAKT